jgi:hypothetical protein
MAIEDRQCSLVKLYELWSSLLPWPCTSSNFVGTKCTEGGEQRLGGQDVNNWATLPSSDLLLSGRYVGRAVFFSCNNNNSLCRRWFSISNAINWSVRELYCARSAKKYTKIILQHHNQIELWNTEWCQIIFHIDLLFRYFLPESGLFLFWSASSASLNIWAIWARTIGSLPPLCRYACRIDLKKRSFVWIP